MTPNAPLTGIKYNAEMALACLEGRKTQTRRLIAMPEEVAQHPHWVKSGFIYGNQTRFSTFGAHPASPHLDWTETCKYGQPGDVMAMLEPWKEHSESNDSSERYSYRSDFLSHPHGGSRTADGAKCSWADPALMPKEAVRQFQVIESLSVQRLQDISEQESLAEGIQPYKGPLRWVRHLDVFTNEPAHNSARDAFAALMDTLYGDGLWDYNPWTWVIKFKPLEAGAYA